MISTRNPSALPPPARLRELCQSLSLLDESMDTSGDYWYFWYCGAWWRNWDFAQIRDGEGNECHVVFAPAGVLIRGFHHELCPVEYDHTKEEAKALESRIFSGLPASLEEPLREVAFIHDLATFGIWREEGDPQWRVGHVLESEREDPDGSEEMLWMLDDNPATYTEWAKEYWGRDVDPALIEAVYRHEPISEGLVLALNPEAKVEKVMASAEAMGFPTSRRITA